MAAITSVIKYEGDNSTFIWKHPCEDFNTSSQLIVHESQEAIFFLNGQALDLFGPGRHTLETQNIPLLRRIINIPTGGESPFHCEVYFINKTEQMAIRTAQIFHLLLAVISNRQNRRKALKSLGLLRNQNHPKLSSFIRCYP